MTAPSNVPLRSTPEGVLLEVKVHPRGRRNAIDGVIATAIKLSVTAPADKGKANQAVRDLLAEVFGLPTAAVTIVSGLTSPRKVIRLTGVDEAAVRHYFQNLPGRHRR